MSDDDDGWVLGEELGRGALGRVVRVRGGDGRVLAGKILHRSHRADPRAVARLQAEARMLAEVRHPNLVGVHGLVEIAGEQVLLMDLVDGADLSTVIARDAPVAAERAVAIARGIAAGLAEAHRKGLVHRDLKPANVLLGSDGVPRIVDFGLARATSLTGVAAGDLLVVGTPAYMAPEALDPMAIDGRSDLYALGCILFELLTGRPPFDGATTVAVLEAHRSAALPEAAELRAAPPELARLVRWLLARSPADRPQSAAVVERALTERTALVPVAERAGESAAALCVRCGAPVVREVPVCFACRAPQITVEDGDHTVFVVGPGQVSHKIDALLRTRLLEWLGGSPGLGLAPGRLATEVPRLPFVLAAAVAPDSARGLIDALRGLGLEAAAVQGGRYALPAMRDKAKQMSKRFAVVAAFSVLPGFQGLGILAVPAIVAAMGAALVGGALGSARVWTKRTGAASPYLPGALGEAIARVGPVVRAMEQERHRDALRGVVVRVLALRLVVPVEEAARIAADLARVVDLGTVAASKLDELERGVDAASLHGGDPAVRQRLRERDTWAARLLEVTAMLDALRARWAVARATSVADDLGDLRAHLEALEELRG